MESVLERVENLQDPEVLLHVLKFFDVKTEFSIMFFGKSDCNISIQCIKRLAEFKGTISYCVYLFETEIF